MNKIEIKKLTISPIMLVVLVVAVAGIISLGTAYGAVTYLYDSKDVSYDNTESGIIATDVQGAVDELYAAATDYSSINTRLTAVEDYKNQIYPVGSIYIGVNNTNPSTLFGGTWIAFGEGRTLIGMGSNGTNDYTTVEDTGGASSHAIEVSNLPVHNHSIPALSGSTTAANSVGSTTSDGKHTHTYSYSYADGYKYDSGIYTNVRNANNSQNTGESGAHTHKLNIPSLTVSTNASNTNGCTNCNGTALDTQDPYITVYMWKRTA